MKHTEIVSEIKHLLSRHAEISFAYVYGSLLSADNPRDADIAVYLKPSKYKRFVITGELGIEFCIPLEMDLEKDLNCKVDVQVLNEAPLGFRHRVVSSGIVVRDNDIMARLEFESLTRVEYFDFRPKMDEYMQEVMA